MGDPPDGKTLDRINNNEGYSKKNCRWATLKEQASNRRPSLAPHTKSGTGLHRKGNRWRARIRYKYKSIFIGSYKTKKEARDAYLKAKEYYLQQGSVGVI
jgi:hypothetical protein